MNEISKRALGEALKLELKKGYDVVRISKWAYKMFSDNRRRLNPGVYDVLQELFRMEDDSQFEYSKEELEELAENLINASSDDK